ncbi:MAG: hypothetical protein KIS92_25365 [Planctomycetota bacterium]|nr:hypothetical protein [Planctomycetota bacterium]
MDESDAGPVPREWVHPAYAWWPWRALAVAVPLLACLAAAGILGAGARMANQGLGAEETAALVWLTVYTAGNALIVGMSSGHLGKSLFAMLAGAFVSYVAVLWFGAWAILAGHALTLPVVFACLDRDATVRTRLTAVGIGADAFVHALRYSFPVAFVLALLLVPAVKEWPATRLPAACLLAGAAFGVQNERFLKIVFEYVQRGENLLPPEIPAPPPEPKPETVGELLKAKRGMYEEPPPPAPAPPNADRAYSEST